MQSPSTIEELQKKCRALLAAKKWKEALPLAEQVVQERQKTSGEGSLALAQARYDLGRCALSLSLFDKAKVALRGALEIFEKQPTPSLTLAKTLNLLGFMEQQPDAQERAAALYTQELKVLEALAPESEEMVFCLLNLAIVARRREALPQALAYRQRALALQEKLTPRSLELADNLESLGTLASDLDQYDTAKSYHERSLALKETLAPGSLDLARTLHNLGNTELRLVRLDQAQLYFERALVIEEKLEPGSLAVAQTLNALGMVAEDREQLPKAESYYKRALALKEKLAPGSDTLALSLAALGRLAGTRKQYKASQGYFERALAIENKVAPNTMQRAITLYNLGNLNWKQGNLAKAQDYLEKTLTQEEQLAPNSLYLTQCLDALAQVTLIRGSWQSAERYQVRLLEAFQKIQEREGLSIASEPGIIGEDTATALQWVPTYIKSPTQSYRWIPTLRGVALTLQLQALALQRQSEQDPKLAQAAQELASATEEEQDGVTNAPPSVSLAERKKYLTELKMQRQSKELALTRLLKTKHGEVLTQLALSPQQVQACLEPGQVLVEFLRHYSWDTREGERGSDQYGAFVVAKTGPIRFVPLGKAAVIDESVGRFMGLVSQKFPKPQDTAQLEAQGRALYRKLIAPLGKLPERVLIAPDGALYQLPFSALIAPNGKFLIETTALSFVGSGRDLVQKPPTAATTAPAVLAAPTFDSGPDTLAPTVASLKRPAPLKLAQDRASQGLRWQELPGAAREGEQVGRLLGVSPWLGADAAQERLFSLERPRVLHIATHGFFYPAPPSTADGKQGTGQDESLKFAENPMLRSGLVFAGANQEAKLRERGLLSGWATALELSQLDLRGTELVVLSACNTGRGDVRLGEGVFGLQRAFRFAGAQSLIMSLFTIPDAASSTLFTHFYRTWKPGQPAGSKLAALRRAQLTLLRNPQTRHPKHWAGFVLLGAP